MSQVYATPGVYIEEKSAFPNSAVAVATAVPAFVGHTDKALMVNKSLLNKPTRITSLNEYHQYFGEGPKIKFGIASDPNEKFKATIDAATKYNLYNALRLFFANGGSTCYIVSVGDYKTPLSKDVLIGSKSETGIATLLKEPEPTMLVIPDAVLLGVDECYDLQQKMLMHCGFHMKNRVAILDIHNGNQARVPDPKTDVISIFREKIGTSFLQWGAAYYPWVETTIVSSEEVNLYSFTTAELANLTTILNDEIKVMVTNGLDADKAKLLNDETAKLANIDNTKTDPKSLLDANDLHQTLLATIPLYRSIMNDMRGQLNVIAPSAGMAGVISMVDNSVGVSKSPANVSMGSVVKPTVNITSAIQEDLNLPLNGKAVNAIRTFPGKGVLVWGARTLDGNSQDWRYLSVRRTLIMLEQSIKIACEAYVFEPNVANTWVTVKGVITNFLTDQWKRGALAGATPEDAFSVDCGLGVTMTPTDVLDGIMAITVKVAIVRPAEFIVITFQQQMQKS
jgi:phage tail sheath protein FI